MVPDPTLPAGVAFGAKAAALSRVLNASAASAYELNDADPASERLSLAHCTLLHLRVPTDEARLEAVVAPFLGRALTLTAQGIIFLPHLPAFDRDAIAAQGSDYRPAEGLIHDLVWWQVQPKRDLLALQAVLAEAVTEAFGDICLTKRGDDYKPHFTLWLNECDITQSTLRPMPGLDWPSLPHGTEVPCRLVLGDCGQVGQIKQHSKFY